MKHIILIFLLIILFWKENPAYSQLLYEPANQVDITKKTELSRLQPGQIRELYYSQVSIPGEMVYGKEYLSYYYRSKIIPLLSSGKEFHASLIMNDRIYKNILLQYDTFLDEVIFTDKRMMINFQFPKIALNKNIITRFTLYTETDSMLFEYVKFPLSGSVKFQDGFYEIAYKGSSQLLIRHLSKEYTTSQAVINYEYTPQMLVYYRNKYFKIKNKKSLLSIFSESTHNVEKQLKEAGIKSKITDKNQIINILKYFDSLPVEETEQL